MTMTEFLDRVNANLHLRKWCEGKTPEQAWRECHDGRWLLYVAARLLPKKTVVKVCCAVARQALAYVPEGEDAPRICIETAEAWTRGEATIEQVMAARAYAYAAAADAVAAAAADAVAAYADAAAAAAAAAADAAYAAAAAAAAVAAYAAAYAKSLSASADIVRQQITWDMIEEALEK